MVDKTGLNEHRSLIMSFTHVIFLIILLIQPIKHFLRHIKNVPFIKFDDFIALNGFKCTCIAHEIQIVLIDLEMLGKVLQVVHVDGLVRVSTMVEIEGLQ